MATGYKLLINARETSYDVNKNTSNVSIAITATSPVALQYGGWNFYATTCKVTCNGITKNINVPSYDFRNSQSISFGSVSFNDITHNDDGKKTISISVSWDSDNAYVLGDNGSQTITASANLKLTDIPRKATIVNADDFTDESNPTITYSNPAGNNVSSLQVCISLDGSTADISYRDVSKTGTSYTFNLTESERNILRNATLNSKSRTIIYYIKTVINDVMSYTTADRTFTVINASPSVGTITYQDTNSAITTITGDPKLIVQNKSLLSVSFTNAAPKKGASIVKHKFTLNGISKETTSQNGTVAFGAVDSASDLIMEIEVTDSRGYIGKSKLNVNMVEYKNPSAKISLSRLNNYEDETHLLVDGEIASINGKNRMSIKYRNKRIDGAYGEYTIIQDNVTHKTSCDKNYQYVFNIVVTDLLGATFNIEIELNKGIFPLFIDTEKNSVGVNCFPKHSGSLEVNGDEFYVNDKKLIDLIYPVGAIYIGINNISPETFIGGKWQAFGTGRTIVGVDATQAEFNTANKAGGSKMHTLSTNEMPSHSGHMYDNFANSAYVDRGGDTNSYYLNSTASGYSKYANRPYKVVSGNELVMQGFSKGGGQAYSILQPYVTVYMFQRVS